MNLINRVVGWISPQRGFARQAWRDALRHYDAGDDSRLNANWRAINTSAEHTDRYSRDTVRARARDLERNSDMLNGVMGAFVRNVVGGGFTLQSETGDTELNQQIEKLWAQWCKKRNCDVTGTQSLSQMLRMAVRRKKVDGGMLFVKRYTGDGLLPFKLQAMEVDELDGSTIVAKYKGDRVCGGIEYTPYNKPVGYWFRQYSIDGVTSPEPVYVEAKDVIFYFSKRRPSQLREMSDMAPTLPRVRDANEFIVAENVKQRIFASVALFIKRLNPTGLGRAAGGQTGKGACIIELLEDSAAYSSASLTVEAAEVDPSSVTNADIVMGISQADACMTAVGVVPDLLLAPGWSHDTVVAAILATRAAGINGLFGAKCLIDADSSAEGVTEYSQLTAYKNKNNFVDVNQILCWPQVKLGEDQFHLSTQLAGLMASVDTLNGGCPYESPSNKNLKIDGCCLEDGTEVNLTWEQVNLIAGSWGVVTAINFMGMGWTAKGNYTACYPSNTDVKDQFIPISRMFDWVGNTVIRTFWSKLDRPMNRRLIDNILDTSNIWLNGQVAAEHLLGARAEMLEEENNLLDLMAGIIHIHIYITPPSPMQECDFTLEYDVNYVQAALG